MEEIYVPSIDICAICCDGECDGISCVADLDSNNIEHQETLEQLQTWVRAGRAFLQANDVLAIAENRIH